VDGTRAVIYRRALKRPLDVLLAASSLLLLSPLLALIAVAIRLQDGGRVIFRQRRVGRDGTEFWLLKFRSMPENTGDVPSAAAGGLRVTPIGRLLRRTNADELPQLVNILRGEMSIVGPRPALPAQRDLVALRHSNGAIACTPGLTGLAQVNAYDGMSIEAKAEWDGRYAGRISLRGDLIILARTVAYLLTPPPTY
jgi:O-antigen biosynthesis protein WbqP